MFNYSIMPLDTDHFDEIVSDIENQYKSGVCNLALFMMTLVPEGNPTINKAKILTEKYILFRDALRKAGYDCGVLVQASLGHGYKLDEMFPFTQYVNLTDGKEEPIACPLDSGMHKYLCDAMVTIAKCEPKIIMVDDDFRLLCRAGKGCYCEKHKQELTKLVGREISREELVGHTLGDSEDDKFITEQYIKTQRDSLVELAKDMRAAIDSVDPEIQGAYCDGGSEIEFAEDIAPVLSGKNKPVICRFANGSYHPTSARYITYAFARAAKQKCITKGKIDTFLAETDTCPHNRYSTGAQFLHTFFTGNILEGAAGAKHWISTVFNGGFEPSTGKAYRKILSKNAKFYEKLSELYSQIKPFGCKIPLSDKRDYYFKLDDVYGIRDTYSWSTHVLERLGLPLYFGGEGGAAFLTGGIENSFTDDELKNILSGTVFVASDSLKNLNSRGFGELTGVDTKEWQGENISGEYIVKDGTSAAIQKNIVELVPLDDKVEIDSYNFHLVGGKEKKLLCPAVTVYKNPLGGTVICFCGIPKTWYHYTEAFSMLCLARKNQFVRLLKETGNLPVYYTGDEEVYLRAGYINGKIFTALFNLSYDTAEEINLNSAKNVTTVQILLPDGSFKDCDFEQNENTVTVKEEMRPLDPVILILE